MPEAAQLDAAAMAEVLQAALDTFASRGIYDWVVSSCISRLCRLPGAAQLATVEVHRLLKQAVSPQLSVGSGPLHTLPAATQLNVDQAAELAHSLHKALANTTTGHDDLTTDISLDRTGHQLANLNSLQQAQRFVLWLIGLPTLTEDAARQSVFLSNGLLKAAVSALGGPADGSPLPYMLQQLCGWPGARQQQVQEVQELLHMAVQVCSGWQLPPDVSSACLGSLSALPAAANLSTPAAVELVQAAFDSGALCCVEQLSRLPAAANMTDQQAVAFIRRAIGLHDLDMVAGMCSTLQARAMTVQSITELVTTILVQFSTTEQHVQNQGHEQQPPLIHSNARSAVGALETLLSLPAAEQSAAVELAGMLHAAAASNWGYEVLLPLLGAVLRSQPSPVVQATLSQLTEQQAEDVLTAAAAAGNSCLISNVAQDAAAGSSRPRSKRLLELLRAAVENGSTERVCYLAALPSAAEIGAGAVEGLLRTAVGLSSDSRELSLGCELCKLPGAQEIGPVGLVLLLEAAVHTLDVERMVLLPAAADICPGVVACLVDAAKAAEQAGKARALGTLLKEGKCKN